MSRFLAAAVRIVRRDAVVTETIHHMMVDKVRVGTGVTETGDSTGTAVEVFLNNANETPELCVLVQRPGEEAECVYSEELR